MFKSSVIFYDGVLMIRHPRNSKTDMNSILNENGVSLGNQTVISGAFLNWYDYPIRCSDSVNQLDDEVEVSFRKPPKINCIAAL